MAYFLGVDVGSVNAKLSLVEEYGNIVHLDVRKITTNARTAVDSLISTLGQQFNLDKIVSAGVTGSTKDLVPKELNWAENSSSLVIASGLLHNYPDARTIIQIGGQSSHVIELEDGLKKPWKMASNPLCAAGTGRFLEQQAYRLGISMDRFATLALQCQESAPRIAARCSVFAKSDLIHLQQKGVPVEAMLYALCESIARMVVSLRKGYFEEPVYFVGGVAANNAIVKALNEALSTRNRHKVEIIVPENYLYMAALGSALLSKGHSSRVGPLPEEDAQLRHFELPRLPNVAIPEGKTNQRVEESCLGYLGVDVGSTSTKAVILDESGKTILAKNYLMTAGRPIDAVKQVFRNLLRDGAQRVRIAGTGVTGSGRYLIGSLIGADIVKNEITAQTRAATEIDPEADIIEVGGQDSKLVVKRNGVVVDYQMNKACAAGTGSFIDELAEMLGISVMNGDFARLAFSAPNTIDLGTRCAAFMGQSVASAQQEGVSLEVITASLATSIAKNYLSKVVGTRKLGTKVILTGAVFYNQAVVSAFCEQLNDKTVTTAEHREVSGAIGAALIAKETVSSDGSKFKGFQEVIDANCVLSIFTCKACDNNCAITRMEAPNEKPTFFGSRCDLFDSTLTQAKKETFFDEREKLLLRDYKENMGTDPMVGIPRALLVHDYAPLLIGFLNALGAKVILSGKTNKEIIERSVELSYTDSCFPLKLLHGHITAFDKVDYILYPSAIRLGIRDGEENQKYSCPLVQASPFIVRQALGLGDHLLIPTIDLSQGDTAMVKSLVDVAAKMGFSSSRSRKAALAGIDAQHRFEVDSKTLGNKLLKRIYESDQLGVVLLSRSYMSQDSGANLGIAEKLAQLGVVPIPLDFLPLDSIDPKEYTDRPYWSYEGKLIAGAAIAAANPHLYGLIITNFGCGPNSFILRILEDITGDKPLGQLEIDEHAAEAGIVTRLEAFVDTIQGYASLAKHGTKRPYIYRGTSPLSRTKKTILIPRMGPFIEALAAAMEAYGVRTAVLPEPDDRSLLYGNQVTSGTECLPYRIVLGDFIRFYYENNHDVRDVEVIMAGEYGPCRFGKYAVEQMRVLREIGIDLPIRTSMANGAYRDLGLGPRFERLVWKGIVAIDCLQKLLWRTRPYEKVKGQADSLFDEYMARITGDIRRKQDMADTLDCATAEFKSLVDLHLPKKSLVGINGEIYLRSNRFSNGNVVRECEEAGLEVVVSSIGEWVNYTSYSTVKDAIQYRKIGQLIDGYIRKAIRGHDERSIARHFHEMLPEREPSTEEILAKSAPYLPSECRSEALLSIGGGIEWLENPEFAGIISVMPHGCMPGGIVAAISEKLSETYQKPCISLTYDGFLETNNRARIGEFAELIKFCSVDRAIGSR
ncbi:acyl-CoA dehydratase activase [Chloroflexota bacterium]